MRLLMLWLIFDVLFIFQCSCFTYWVDNSCIGNDGPVGSEENWEKFMQEAFSMARRAADRLSSDSDTDFSAVFKRIFKIEKSDSTTFRNLFGEYTQEPVLVQTGKDFVFDKMRSIGRDWHSVTRGTEQQRLDSNVRLYCDNDARWKPAKSTPGILIDKANGLFAREVGPPCQTRSRLQAKVYREPLVYNDGRTPQAKDRHTITFCDAAFNVGDVPISLFEVPPNVDLGQHNIKLFSATLSKTILHEFTHLWPYNLLDIPNDVNPLAPYGWDNIVKIESTEHRINNADSYAYLGIWALLADRVPKVGDSGGHTLTRLFTGRVTRQNPDAVEEAERDANEGKIASYRDLTKRWLNVVARMFRA
ncbi:hypothetical protein VTL71DRAFT_12748 [Oculimacula yallundae]|uniref:Uncharacterized protein n=1 Tax=Oculimacula yallundae TaxID=86028 RepID=A0ABR4CQ86_9HELO